MSDSILDTEDNSPVTTDIRETVQSIKAAILKSQARAAQMVNHEQLSLYYGIGRYISEHSREGYWGTGAIARISKQLKSELPGLKGFSEENIKLMRRFYEAWKDIETKSVVGTTEIPQSAVSQLPVDPESPERAAPTRGRDETHFLLLITFFPVFAPRFRENPVSLPKQLYRTLLTPNLLILLVDSRGDSVRWSPNQNSIPSRRCRGRRTPWLWNGTSVEMFGFEGIWRLLAGNTTQLAFHRPHRPDHRLGGHLPVLLRPAPRESLAVHLP